MHEDTGTRDIATETDLEDRNHWTIVVCSWHIFKCLDAPNSYVYNAKPTM